MMNDKISWDSVPQGSISSLSIEETQEVNGANPVFVVIAIAGFQLGYNIGRDRRDRETRW